jgi:hypothetical protein
MMRSMMILPVAVCVFIFSMTVFAGNLESPVGPEALGSAMYTLEDIYNRLDEGTAGEKRTGAFKEPTVGPTMGTSHTLNEIMDRAPVADNANGAVPADVSAGRTYWGVRTDGTWGPQTGTSTACPPAPTGNATVNDVRLGKTFSNQSGVGLTGEGLCPSICTGDATEDDVQSGKTFSNETEVGLTGNRHGGCVCSGTLNGTRWCDNGDGTVTDLTTCLVWLKKADWGGKKVWTWRGDYYYPDDAHTRAGILAAGTAGADLSDGSSVGDWRLPTKTELYQLTHGTEAVSYGSPRAFTGVLEVFYWSSTVDPDRCYCAYSVHLRDGHRGAYGKACAWSVWPVRAGQ